LLVRQRHEPPHAGVAEGSVPTSDSSGACRRSSDLPTVACRHPAVDVAGGRGTDVMRTTTTSIGGMGRLACRVWDRAVERPVFAVVVASAAVRLSVALVLNLFDIWSFAPDAIQYMAVAEANAEGRLEGFWFGYGASLYESTLPFSGQLSFLFELFGPYRLLGQLVAVFYGALTAGLTAYLALRLLGWDDRGIPTVPDHFLLGRPPRVPRVGPARSSGCDLFPARTEGRSAFDSYRSGWTRRTLLPTCIGASPNCRHRPVVHDPRPRSGPGTPTASLRKRSDPVLGGSAPHGICPR